MTRQLQHIGKWLVLFLSFISFALCASVAHAGATTTTLTASPSPSSVGQNVTLTATITGTAPTGTVTFKDGTTLLGTATITGSTATFVKNFSVVGTKNLVASYAGDANNTASASSVVTLAVNKRSTTTALTLSPNPATVGQNVTLTATVTPAFTTTNPTGTVTFKDGATTLGSASLAGGTVSITRTFSTSGAHSITAVYGGDGNNATSTSTASTLTVNGTVSTTTTTITANPSPSSVGQNVTLTAAVTGNNPTGLVTFKDGTTILGTGNVVAGQATLIKAFNVVGTKNLVASYVGDANNTASTSSAVTLAVNKRNTTTALTVAPNPATPGQNVTLTATVAPTVTTTNPTGTVTFKDGATTLGTGTLAGGVATLTKTFTTGGAHSITAVYGGDGNNNISTSAVATLNVNVSSASTTALTVTPNPAVAGQYVALTATVTGNSPTGTVTFKDGGMTIGIDSLTNGAATLGTTLSAGTYNLSVVYGGDNNNLGSTSDVVALAVNGQSGPTQYTFEYDAQGNRTKATTPLGAVTEHSYDALGRPIEQRQAKALGNGTEGKVGFVHDGQDQLVGVTDPRNLTTSYTKNGLGQKTQQVSPDTGTTNKVYDEADNLIQETDANGVVIQNLYDALNRLTTTTYTKTGIPTETEIWTYGEGINGKGHLTTITDGSGQTKFTYNPDGQVLTKTQVAGGLTRILKNDYNSVGQLTTVTYPSGQQITFTHNANGQVQSISRNGAAIISNIAYVPFGPANRWNWGNNQNYMRTFDANGRMTSYALGNASRTLTWDAASRLTQIRETNNGVQSLVATAGYDNLDRLTSFNTMSSSYGYQYDLTGNRTRLSINGNSYAYSIAADSNRLMSTAGPTPAKTYVYNNKGNPNSDGQRIYTWTNSDRLKSVTIGGVTTNYSYNADAHRVSKTNTNGTTVFVYQGDGKLIGEYDQNGNVIAEYLWFGDTPVAMWTGNAATQTYYIFTDQIDTPRAIADAAGKILWRWDGEAFGLTMPNEDVDGDGIKLTCNLRFPGQYFDKESNLHYNWYRYLDPITGRYVTSDPIGLDGGINTYGYTGANPISVTDASGLQANPNPAPITPSPTPTVPSYGPAANDPSFFPSGGAGLLPYIARVGGGIAAALWPNTAAAPTLNQFYQQQNNELKNQLKSPKKGSDCDCDDILNQINLHVQALQIRYWQALRDMGGLYCDRPTGKHSWEGHGIQYSQVQANLRGWIALAIANGCPVSDYAREWSVKPFPTCPMNYWLK